jgi:DNA-binding MarR family transcriptional regulator
VIAERAQVSRQAIAKVIDDLERVGLVPRDPDPQDGRGVIGRLTEMEERRRGRDSRG